MRPNPSNTYIPPLEPRTGVLKSSHYRPRRKTQDDDSILKYWVIGCFALGVGLILCLVFLVILFAVPITRRMPSGTTIADIDISGTTLDEVRVLLMNSTPQASLIVTDNERSWRVPLAELGIGFDVEGTMNNLEKEIFQARYFIDLFVAQSAFLRLSEMTDIAPTATEGGRRLNIPALLQRLQFDVNGEITDYVLDLRLDILPPDPSLAPRTHTVLAGQTLVIIAQMYSVTVEQIVELNNLTDPNMVYEGQELRIPQR